MSTSVASVVSHFPDAENGFTTTTAGSVSSGAATVTLNSVSGYTNGEPVVFVIDPTDAAKKQTFTGIIDTAGVQVTSVVWTAGTNQIHALGATVVDYATATHIAMMSKGIKVEHNQSGVHSTALITSRTEDTDPDPDADFVLSYDTSATALKKVKMSNVAGSGTGWTPNVLAAPDTITYNGNRSYSMVFNSVDYTSTVSAGMRLRLTRTVSAPTQCADLEAGSSQYFNDTSVAGTTFTDNFCAGAWVKTESNTVLQTIVSRYNGTSGWSLTIGAAGLVSLTGFNAASANFSQVISSQTIPLGKWVHIAAQLDMSAFTATSTTSYVMIDGKDVTATVARAGTNPTALVQAGNLEVGARNGGTSPFDGKLAQVFYSSAKITQANMQTLVSQGLTAALCTTHSIVSAYSLSNSITDINTTTANDLTAQGSAVATNVDSPFGNYLGATLEYGAITKTAFSTNTTLTVQVPEGCAIPTSGGVSSVSYSTHSVPYLFPNDSERWAVETYIGTDYTETMVAGTWEDLANLRIDVPVGTWQLSWEAMLQQENTSASVHSPEFALGTDTQTPTDVSLIGGGIIRTSSTSFGAWSAARSVGIKLASDTPYYALINVVAGAGTITAGIKASTTDTYGMSVFRARPSFL